MTELAGPTRVDIAETDGRIVAATPALRVEFTRDPFSLAVTTADGQSFIAPPAGSWPSPGQPTRGMGAHGPDASFDPHARYLGVTYGIDGMRLGSYNGSSRAPRWYGLTSIARWERVGDSLRLEVATNDIVGRAALVTVAFLDDSVARLRVTFDRDVAIGEVGLAAALPPDEGFFGLGERFARGNHRGHEVLNWIEDAPFDPHPGHEWTNWPVPFFLSSRGYGVLLDTMRRAVFRLGNERSDAWQMSVDGAEMDVVIFAGPEPLDVIRRYTALTGRPPLPEPWAFGVWKTALSGEAAVREHAQRLRDEELGVSALWVYDQLELDTNSGWNSAMGYPEGEYSDLPGLVDDLHERGFKVLGYLNTQFITGRPRTDEGIAKGYFLKRPDGETYVVPGPDPDPKVGIRFGEFALYDPTHPEGRPWWQDLLRRLLTETGYDGWMHDFGEYTPRDAIFADGRTGEEIRNLYPALYHRSAAEVCRAAKPDHAYFVRSGYIGSNQWAPAAWPADQHTDWSPDRGLPSIVPAALSVGICGTNTWGPDIGGFFDAYDGSDIARSTELWIRWCQFGALTPLMRDHLGPKRMTTPDAIDLWSNEQTVATWRRYARLHNALVPYLYAYAREAHETGVPTMRHMVLHSPEFPEAQDQDYQYLLGRELLVAPVVEQGATTREVWFPPGTWYSFWDDREWTGPGYATVPAPIEQIPLFVRAGSVLPQNREEIVTLAGVSADELLSDLELRVYPTGSASAAASSFAFHDGSTARLEEAPGRLLLTFTGAPADRRHTIRLPARFAVIEASGEPSPLAHGSAETAPDRWTGDGGATTIEVPPGVARLEIVYA
jgi:alpha-glucosidase (family GH31 glycosyl hydrolase)